jgi:hypothetical protein
MAINLEGCSGTKYTFEGPYNNTNSLHDNSGVYIIICDDGESLISIDVGESATVKNRVENHDRKDCWESNCNHTLKYGVLYTPNKQQAGRKEVEEDIRCNYNFPCGDR